MKLKRNKSLKVRRPLKMMAVLGALIVLMLDVFAASPILHEAVCHHSHCIENSEEDETHQDASDHSHKGCYGCVITLFATGHVTPFLWAVFLIQKEKFSFSWKTVTDYKVCSQSNWFWPHQTGPPVIM